MSALQAVLTDHIRRVLGSVTAHVWLTEGRATVFLGDRTNVTLDELAEIGAIIGSGDLTVDWSDRDATVIEVDL